MRWSWAIGVLVAVLLAGCGGGSGKGGASGGGRAEALSFLPKSSPFVAEIATDPNGAQVKQALSLARRLPGGDLLLGQIESSIFTGGVHLSDVKPILGNDFALAPVNAAGLDTGNFVGALVVADAGKAKSLLAKSATKTSSHDGFDVYKDKEDPTTFYGLDGSDFVIADGQRNLFAAIDRHKKGGGETTDGADALASGLPGNALVKIYGLVAPLIASSPDAAQARQVPFVRALKGYGAALTATNDGVDVAFRVDTSNANLPATEQPLTGGSAPAALADLPPVVGGLRELGHTIQYAEHLGQLLAPAGFQQFAAGLQAIKQQTGVDIQKDFLGQMGTAVVATNLKLFAVRVAAKSPALGQAVTKLRPIVPAFLEGAGVPGLRLIPGPSGLTLLARGHSYFAAFGMVGDQLVFGTASPQQLLSFGKQATKPAAGTSGALAVRASTPQLLGALRDSGALHLPGVAGLLFSHFGDLVGSAGESGGAITGKLTLPVK